MRAVEKVQAHRLLMGVVLEKVKPPHGTVKLDE